MKVHREMVRESSTKLSYPPPIGAVPHEARKEERGIGATIIFERENERVAHVVVLLTLSPVEKWLCRTQQLEAMQSLCCRH